MSVFDFNAEAKEERKNAKCTFTLFRSNETTATPEHPILVLDNREKQWEHHSKGVFTNPVRETAFEFLKNRRAFCETAEMAGRK